MRFRRSSGVSGVAAEAVAEAVSSAIKAICSGLSPVAMSAAMISDVLRTALPRINGLAPS